MGEQDKATREDKHEWNIGDNYKARLEIDAEGDITLTLQADRHCIEVLLPSDVALELGGILVARSLPGPHEASRQFYCRMRNLAKRGIVEELPGDNWRLTEEGRAMYPDMQINFGNGHTEVAVGGRAAKRSNKRRKE